MMSQIKGETLFLFTFSIYLFYVVMNTTIWEMPPLFAYFLRVLTVILIVIRLFWVINTYTLKELLLFCTCSLILFITAYSCGYSTFIIPFVFIVTAKNIKFKKILRIYFLIELTILLITVFASSVGILENVVHYRGLDDIPRYSFGYVYPTDFASHIFYLLLAWYYLRGGKLTLKDYVLYLGIAYFIFHNCHARLDSICVLLIIFTSFFYWKIKKQATLNKLTSFVLTYSVFFAALIMLGVTYAYSNPTLFLVALDYILTGRISLGYRALSEDGMKIFGQHYVQKGAGTGDEYNFIDSSFLLIPIIYGISFFVIMLFVLIHICKKSLDKKNYFFPLIIILVAIHSMVSHHLIEFAYNPFFLGAFSCVKHNK